MPWLLNPLGGNTINWKAGCGKTARPVWREGEPNSIGSPYPDLGFSPRRQMSRRLHLTRYSQRWQAETVNSMLKRLMGSALRARSHWSQCRETVLRAISLNVMILKRR
jgi:hypothetical protein